MSGIRIERKITVVANIAVADIAVADAASVGLDAKVSDTTKSPYHGFQRESEAPAELAIGSAGATPSLYKRSCYSPKFRSDASSIRHGFSLFGRPAQLHRSMLWLVSMLLPVCLCLLNTTLFAIEPPRVDPPLRGLNKSQGTLTGLTDRSESVERVPQENCRITEPQAVVLKTLPTLESRNVPLAIAHRVPSTSSSALLASFD